MKNKIVLPAKYKVRATDNYKFLFALLEERLGYHVQYTDQMSWEPDTENIIVFACPQHNNVVTFEPPEHIRVMGYLRDLQTYGNPEVKEAFRIMLERYDHIITPNRAQFERLYGTQYNKKITWMQDFYADEQRYSIPYNTRPKMRCLLSGAISPVYPIRQFILFAAEYMKLPLPLDFLGPAVAGHGYVGDRYADLLNQYFCCVTGGGVFGSLVSKYFEIPAAGSLLLATDNENLSLAGFIPGKHFVKIDYYNVIDVIREVCENPERYEDIRRRGYEFVHAKHGVENRYKIMEELLGESVDKSSIVQS